MSQLAWNDRLAGAPAGRVTERVSDVFRSSPEVLHHDFVPAAGGTSWVVICFLGRTTTAPWALVLLYSCGPRSIFLSWPATTVS